MFTENRLMYILVDMDYLFFLFYLFIIWNSVYVQFDSDLWPQTSSYLWYKSNIIFPICQSVGFYTICALLRDKTY